MTVIFEQVTAIYHPFHIIPNLYIRWLTPLSITARNTQPWRLSINQGTTKPCRALVGPGTKAQCLGGTTKAPPRAKRRAKAWAKAWGLVVRRSSPPQQHTLELGSDGDGALAPSSAPPPRRRAAPCGTACWRQDGAPAPRRRAAYLGIGIGLGFRGGASYR